MVTLLFRGLMGVSVHFGRCLGVGFGVGVLCRM